MSTLYVNTIKPKSGTTVMVTGSLEVSGTIKAYEFNTITVSSTDYLGSTSFGNDSADVHQFTGSIELTGSGVTLVGAEAGAATLTLKADQGDDAADTATISVADGGDLTLDVAGDIVLDADGADIIFKDGGTAIGKFSNSSSDFVIENEVDAKDIVFKQYDGTTTLTLSDDTSVTVATDLKVGDDFSLTSDSAVLNMGAGNDFTVTHDGTTGATLAGNPVHITAGGASTWKTTAGAILVDAEASTVTVDGHTGVTVQSSNSGDITLDSVADIVLDAAGGNFEFKDAGTTQLTIDVDSTVGDIDINLNVDGDDLVFNQYDGTEVIRFTDAATVGIGTSSPGTTLHVYEAATTSGTTQEVLRLEVNDEGVDMIAGGGGPGVDFYVGETGGSNYGGTVGVVREEESDADSDAAMVFHTAADDQGRGNAREKMRITSAGKVGIGDTSPSYTLDVTGDGQFTTDLRVGDDLLLTSDSAILSLGAGNDVTLTHDGGTGLDLTSAGNLDIESTAGSITLGASLADGQTLKLGKNGAVETIIAPHGTAGSEVYSVINTAGTTDGTDAAGSILLSAVAGGIGLAWADGKDLWAEGGRAVVTANEDAADCIKLHADAGTSQTITVVNDAGTSATEGSAAIQLLASAGGVNIKSALNGANAILLTADGGTSETIKIHADRGTGAGSIELTSDAGGIDVNAAGAISLDSSAGSVDINVVDGQTVNVGLNGAVETIWSPHGTAGSELWSTINTAGTTDGTDAAGSILLSAVAGGIGLAWADGKDLWAEGGRFVVTANEDAADCIKLHADAGTSQTITVVNDAGTGASAIGLTATAGGITLTTAAAGVVLAGTTPKLTIGDAGAEDTMLAFDGNAQDFHIALDDTADDLVIGVGTAAGTTTAIAINENAQVSVVDLFAANVAGSFGTFADGDATPSVATGNLWKHHASTQTINTFDDGVAGQTIHVISTAAITYDFDADNLKCGSANIVTASGDITSWFFDGTNWYLLQFMDVSADHSSVGGTSGTITALNNQTESRLVTIGSTTTELDGEANFTYDGTSLACTADTATFSSANSTDPLLVIKNTTNDANGARLRFLKDKGAAGADNDVLGIVEFYGDDAGQTATAFATIKASISEADNTDEAGKLEFFVAESDGTTTTLTAGLVLEGEHATDGEVDVTIAAGAASITTVAGTSQFNGNATFGVDDTGVDVRLYSATASEGVLYDTSEDELALLLTTKLKFHDVGGGEEIYASSNGHLEVNSGTTIDMTAPTVDINASTAVTIDSPSVVISSSTDDKPEVEIKSTNAGANPPTLLFNHDSSSPADDDELGEVVFNGDDDGGASTMFAKIIGVSEDVTNGTEDGSLLFKVRKGGAVSQMLSINVDGGNTINVGDGTAEDTMIVFDGNAQDYRIGLDDGTDKLEIGHGTAHGTRAAIIIDSSGDLVQLGTDTSPSSDDVLTWDGSKWVASAAGGGGATAKAITILASGNSPLTLTTSHGVILVDTSAGAYTVTLPSSDLADGQIWHIKDQDGNAATNNITIALADTTNDILDGATASLVISTNYGSVTLTQYEVTSGVYQYFIL